jgi:tryptophan 2,3-dioxygenase
MALTDYEKYIRTEELLALQKPELDLTCADERQFQIVHQVAELWMKLIEFELLRHATFLKEDNGPRAVSLMKRVNMIQHCLLQQLDLLDTMSPKDYMIVRTGLGRGSGQESPGFKTMLRLPGETVWPAFEQFLEGKGKTLREVYEDPDGCHEIFQVAEGLVDYDQQLQIWRYRHLLIVYRIIGVGTPSLKGKPSDLLAHGMKQRFFPKLWEIRDELFSAWTQSMADKGKDTGYHG